MKKLSLLFACIGLFTFAANAQEPVKAKQPKEVVKVAPVERPIKVAPTTDTKVPQETVKTSPAPTAEAKRTTNVKKHPIIPVKAKATAVPVVKAGEAK